MPNYKHIRNTIGLFAVVGVGLGLSGYIALDFMQATFVEGTEKGSFIRGIGQMLVGLAALQTSFVTFLLGSVVATATGLSSAKSYVSARKAAVFNGIASTIGFPLMVGIAIVIMLLALSGGGGEAAAGGTPTTTPTASGGQGGSSILDQFDMGNIATKLLTLCIPTGLVGAAAGYVGFGFEE